MKLKTGDIILFSGKGFISKLIQISTKSKFSHIGIVYRTDGEEPLIFHSTSLTQPKGTKLQKLIDVIISYNGKLYVRNLEQPLTKMECVLVKNYIKEHIGASYESSLIELILAAFGRKLNIKVANPTSALYCSEAVANIYRLLELMKHHDALTPADFSEKKDYYLRMIENKLINQLEINKDNYKDFL